jgi:hypothetical protein
MNCGNCRFYTEKSQCVRFPPQLVLFANGNQNPISYETCSAWPNVGEYNWCGEWRDKLIEKESEAPVKTVEEFEVTSNGLILTSRGWIDPTKFYFENPICDDLCLYCHQHKDLHVGSNFACPIRMGNEA